MKILFIAHHIQPTDGWSRYVKDIAVSLQRYGSEVLCLVNQPSVDKMAGIAERVVLEAPLSYIANPFVAIKTAGRVQPIIDEFQPDIIHIIVEPYGTMLPFLKTGKANIVLTAHSTYAYMPILVSGLRRFSAKLLTKAMFARVNLVICVSEYTKKHLLTHVASAGIEELVKEKIFVLAGGVDVKNIQTKKTVSVPERRKEILFVGAVKPRKGLREAVEALAQVKSDFIYRVVGTFNEKDPYIQLVRARIAQLGLSNQVIFEGQISDARLEELYAHADLFLMLSTNNGADFEGYGLVYIEASAHGVPCIGPNDSGVTDAIRDGVTGFLVDQYNPKLVAEKIDSILIEKIIKPEDCRAWAEQNSIEEKAVVLMREFKKLLKT